MTAFSTSIAARTTSAHAAVKAPRLRGPRPLVGESKACTKCGQVHDLSEFAIKRGGRAAICRACQKQASDANYRAKPEAAISRANIRNKVAREALRQVRDTYLAQHPGCEHCGTKFQLQLTPKDGYEGKPSYEVISAAMKIKYLVDAINNSRVLCKPCMSSEYGSAGSPAGPVLSFS